MAAHALRSEERLALAIALAAHAGLLAWLALKPPAPAQLPPPERMVVTLSEDIGLTSTSPEPLAQAAPDTAPEVGEPAPLPSPEPVKAEPKPLPKPKPAPVVAQKPSPKPAVKPQPKPAPPASARAQAQPAKPTVKPGASRFADAFNKGIPGAQASGRAQNPPAAAVGPAVKSALAGAISRQLKPKWVAPQGADAERLVTILSWDLNADGSLASAPRVVRQDGITDANRAQAKRHAEQAIRAVRLAAPFDLPEQYYSAWKRIADFRFDRKLSQ